jgi:hypothetical protein
LVKGFGEDICELVVGVNMNKVNVPFLIVVSQEVKTDLYVLGFGVENGVLATHMALVLSQNNGTRLNSKP